MEEFDPHPDKDHSGHFIQDLSNLLVPPERFGDVGGEVGYDQAPEQTGYGEGESQDQEWNRTCGIRIYELRHECDKE